MNFIGSPDDVFEMTEVVEEFMKRYEGKMEEGVICSNILFLGTLKEYLKNSEEKNKLFFIALHAFLMSLRQLFPEETELFFQRMK